MLSCSILMNWVKAKQAAADRDDGKCQRCLGAATDVHHRMPKGMGGTSNPDIAFSLDNLICLCRECHNFIHQHPAEGYESGFLVHSWEVPTNVPLKRGGTSVF